MRSRVAAALAALSLGSSVPAHGLQEPTASVSQQAGPDLEYWRRLGDTTLTRLIDEALRANLDVQVAEARVRSARAARTGARWELLPQGQLSGSLTRRRFAGGSFPGVDGRLPDQSLWDVGAEAAWELDVFGRLRSGVRAQGALVEASEADRLAVQVAIAAEVGRAYFDLRGAQEQLEVARRNSENQQRTLALTRERLDAGRGTAFDTERATAQLASTRASIPLVETLVAAATYRIGVLLGRAPTALTAALAPVAPLPAFPDSMEVGEADVIAQARPDVQAAERFAAAQSAFVGAAKAEYFPRLTVGATVGLLASDPSGLGDEGSFRYAVGPVLTWPLLSLGRISATVSQARAAEDAARVEYRQATLAALEDVQNALTRYRAARLRAFELQASSGASRNAADLARMRYTEGIADFLQVLDAERTQLESERLLALGRTEVATAYAGLYKAIGGR
jgi:multidrug efflux system outer membrane protein